MENIVELLEIMIQYGIAGAALLMMYSITYNHLTAIERILLDIRDLISSR